MQTVDDDLADGFDLSVKEGAVINDIVSDSPADEAGLREDDVIIAINGSAVSDQMDVTRAVRRAKPGDKMTLTIMRGDKKMDFAVTLTSEPDRMSSRNRGRRFAMPPMPSMPPMPAMPHAPEFNWSSNDDGGMIGITMTPLTEQLGDYFGVKDGEGALITEVLKDATAEMAGLKAGDVIIAVDGDQVYDVGDVAKAVGDKDVDDSVKLTIIRDKKQMELSVVVADDDRSPRRWGRRDIDGLRGMQFFAPRMHGLHHGGADDDMIDLDQFREDRDQLRKELDQLRRELEELKKGK
ncbi:MAG: PDZ domain-containing protein [candidate division Zixibacteria bacterium]|nr:PDZ domain-containing protein [candidate division Zixibacteria bacterium]